MMNEFFNKIFKEISNLIAMHDHAFTKVNVDELLNFLSNIVFLQQEIMAISKAYYVFNKN